MKKYLLAFISSVISVLGASAISNGYENVAVGKTTSQSHYSTAAGFAPGNAVDGNVTDNLKEGWNDGDLRDADATTNTLAPGANTWTVDLGSAQPLESIRIYFEGAYARKFNIEFFNEDPATATAPAETVAVTNNSPNFELGFGKQMLYRYVRLDFLEAVNVNWGIKIFEVELYRLREGLTPISQMKNLVYSDGPWKALITGFAPGHDNAAQHPDKIIDNNADTNGGWPDNSLGSSSVLTKGDVWFTVDLARPCNISAIKAINSGAVINGYTIEFYDAAPAGEAAPLSAFDYTTTATDNGSIEEIYLPATVEGVRYVRFLITSIMNPAYGGRFRELEFYGPDNDELAIDRLVLSDNKLVVGRTDNLTVQAVTEHGVVIYNNLDANFTYSGDAVSIGTKTAAGYPFTGVAEAIVPVIFTAADPHDPAITLTGSASLIVASPLDQHVCLVNHTSNRLSVAHQSNPVAPYLADNAINGVTDNASFRAGWDDASLVKAADGSLNPHANWWLVDLRRTANIEAVRIHWSANRASRYKIEVFPADVNLYEDYRTDPAAADALAIYSQIVENDGEATQLIRFDEVVEGGMSLRLTMLDAAGNEGIQFHEVCLLGRENPDLTIKSLALVRKDVNIGETRKYAVYGYTNSGYTLGGLEGATLEINGAEASGYAGEIRIEENGRITGVKKGITPIILKWGNFTTETFMEVTTANWTNTVNIARKFSTSQPSAKSKNGFTLGNHQAKVWASGIRGAENESVTGLIDGDWMSWTITAEEMRAEEKPYVVLDLGSTFPVNEFNIHWQADGDGDGNGSYIMLSGNYRVYASTDNLTWAEVYTVDNRPIDTYDVDRHAFRARELRYLKFEFTSPKTFGQNVSINEITVGGPLFYNAADGTFTDYPGSYVLEVTTPRFDRSNINDRSADNQWIVTSSNVSDGNPLLLSYLAVDCYGRSWLSEDAEVEIRPVDADGNFGAPLDANEATKHYRDVDWKVFPYNPTGIGSQVFTAAVTGHDGAQPAVMPLTVYTITDRGNINRYSYAYDNAVDYTPGTKEGDRDHSHLGTAPQNAADGNFGSWYAIGYYGEGNTMGQTYKYPANTVLERPYELVMDYRGADGKADRFVTELDMLGIQFEGAFARDYKVYILHCDENGHVTDENAWEEVASFVNLQPMGVGVTETQRIYPAKADGTPDLDADGHIIPWTNVAAIKVQMLATGTQWGIKMMESAIYGKLNKTILPLLASQARYATHSGYSATEPVDNGAFHSFDLSLAIPYPEDNSELGNFADELESVAAYRVELEMKSLSDNTWHTELFTEAQAPSGVLCYDAATGKEITVAGEITADGKYAFTVPASADHMLDRVLVRDVNPSNSYIASATALSADGSEIDEVAVDKSLDATLAIPQSAFVNPELGIKSIDAEITNRHELATAGGQAMSLGSDSREGGRKSFYNNVNAAVIRGWFQPLAVTDHVVGNWTVKFDTDIDLDGISHKFATSFEPGAVKATAGIDADIAYVPLHTAEASAADITGEALDGAPAYIRELPLTVLDTEASLSLLSTNVVSYTLGEKCGISPVAGQTEAVELSQSSLASIFAAPAIDSESTLRKVFPIGWVWNPSQSDKPYDAIVSHSFHISTQAKAFAGFHATNEVHALAVEDGADIIHGGIPLHADDELMGVDAAIPDYDEAGNNFGQAAALTGKFGLRLHNVHNAVSGNETVEAIAPIYTLLTAEYPLALCQLNDDNSISGEAHPMLSIAGAATVYHAPAAMAADSDAPVHLQVISSPAAVNTEFDLERDLTAITQTEAAAAGKLSVYPNPADTEVTLSAGIPLGSIEIFTLDGALVATDKTDTESTSLNVSGLASGVYIIRAAGQSTRLIKR